MPAFLPVSRRWFRRATSLLESTAKMRQPRGPARTVLAVAALEDRTVPAFVLNLSTLDGWVGNAVALTLTSTDGGWSGTGASGTITWGDSSSTAFSAGSASSTAIRFTHVYTSSGDYTIAANETPVGEEVPQAGSEKTSIGDVPGPMLCDVGGCDPYADPLDTPHGNIDPGFSPPNYFGPPPDAGFDLGGSGIDTGQFGAGQPVLPMLGEGSANGNPNMFSEGPIRYADGVIQFSVTDIASDGFGFPWAQTRSWSNGTGYANGANGDGWVSSQFPTLLRTSSANEDTLVVVSNGTTARYFDKDAGGVYVERHGGFNTLTHNSSTKTYTLANVAGTQFRFDDFDATNATAGTAGKLCARIDAYGNEARFGWDDFGRVSYVERGGSVESQSVTERWEYAYLTGADNGLLGSVALKRATGGSIDWSTVAAVRAAVYTYYGASESFGTERDLKLVEVKSGSTVLGTQYYRYHTSGNFVGGLSHYFDYASYERLVQGVAEAVTAGTLPSGTTAQTAPETATNWDIKNYATNYFEYDAQHRVSLERVQGAGCSACSGGVGEYTFGYASNASFTPDTDTPAIADYNTYEYQTTETLPDGNQNVVYSNAFG